MTLVIILAALALAIWAVSDPVGTGALATAFRVVIGLMRNPARSSTAWNGGPHNAKSASVSWARRLP